MACLFHSNGATREVPPPSKHWASPQTAQHIITLRQDTENLNIRKTTHVLRIRGGGRDLFESTDEEDEEDHNMDTDHPQEELSDIN